MRKFSAVVKAFLRFLTLWVVDGLSLLATAALFPGITLQASDPVSRTVEAFAAAFLLGIVNLLIRPLILLIARPLGFFVLFIVGFLVNGVALLITSALLPTFEVSNLFSAVVGGLVFSAINLVLTGILEINDEGSFYQGVIERRAAKQAFAGAKEQGRGLVMLEIDGLSYHHLRKTLADGRMPAMQDMIGTQGYVLSKVDCGIPSQTSACQAGIMFGDNYDIPAFRWYDKDQQKLIVSGSDAAELNARYAKGNGLMRGGSSIDNMLNGDAEKSLLTMADLFPANAEERKRRAQDIYLLLLNPYFLTRTLVLFFTDVLRELWQAWQQKRQGVWPRLNRLAHGYPFVRAATTVLVRDISANLCILDIIRGAPSIYVTWPGYDEVAHHSGPWTRDAFGVLETYDQVIDRVRAAIQEKAPRPYDLIILSDHGQSFGPTFKQRYGSTLKEFIELLLPHGTTVSQAIGGDTGAPSLTAMSAELGNIQGEGVGGRTGRVVAQQGQKLLDQGAKRREEAEQNGDRAPTDGVAQVTAYGSGNLAQVYFDLYPRKIKLSELDAAYPGMVEALVQHEGIGIVCGYEDDGTPVALGKGGRRNLHTDEVMGEDPLKLYAPEDPEAFGHATVETRAWQVRRVMDFPHAGDLMVISTVYPDGTVAALEELIGNHGGLGGEQTDAFIFHPSDLEVTPTRNSIDVFHILNNQRGRPPREEEGEVAAPEEKDDWALDNLWAGLKDVTTWLGLAARCVFLDRSAYRQVVQDPRMTGPAVLLGLLFSAIAAIARAELNQLGTSLPATVTIPVGMVGWLFAVLLVSGTGKLLTRKGSYTRTLRALGFARVPAILELLVFLPILGPIAYILGSLVAFIATWMGAAEAHETRGWRTIVLPFLALASFIIVPMLLLALIGGAVITVESVLGQLGLVRP